MITNTFIYSIKQVATRQFKKTVSRCKYFKTWVVGGATNSGQFGSVLSGTSPYKTARSNTPALLALFFCYKTFLHLVVQLCAGFMRTYSYFDASLMCLCLICLSRFRIRRITDCANSKNRLITPVGVCLNIS